MTTKPRSSLVQGEEGLNLANCQPEFVIVHEELSIFLTFQ